PTPSTSSPVRTVLKVVMFGRRGLVGRRRGNRDAGYTGSLPEAGVSIDPVAHMQDELRGSARDSLPMWHMVEGPLQFAMLFDVRANILHVLAGGLEALLEFGLGLDLSLA